MLALLGSAALVGCTEDLATPTPGGGGGGSGGTDSDPTPTATPTAEPTRTHEIGEAFQVGAGAQAIEYTITGIETTTFVGQSAQFGEEADGLFLVVALSMTNVGDESLDLSTRPFRAIDSQDREFEVDTQALIYLEDAIVFEQLNPGLETQGKVLFDVNPGDGYRLRIEPAGFLSDADPHEVALGTVEEE